MKTAAAFLVALAVAGCASQSREDIFLQAQEERVRNEIVATQRRTYFDCMALRGHARQGGVERVRR